MNALLLSFLLLSTIAGAQTLNSGLDIGDECPAFDPYHVSGPDKNSTVCPMCKYGSRQGVMVWVNDSDWKVLDPILQRLEAEVNTRGSRQFRVFVIYMNPDKLSKADMIQHCRDQAKRLKLDKVALTCVISPTDHETAGVFKINPDKEVKNTVLVYSRRRVAHKVINLKPDGLNDLIKVCDNYFSSHPL